MTKRILSIMLAAIMLLSLVACSSTSSNADTNSDSASSVDQEQPMQGNPDATPAETSDEAPASAKTETEEVSWDPEVFNLDDDIDHYLGNYGVPGNVPSYNLPLVDEPVTLTYFYTNQFVQECGFESLAENEMWKQVMDMTGINIVFRHHDPNSAQEKLSLMLASNDLTDLVQDLNTLKTSRSLDSAVEEGLYVDLMMYPELIPHLMGVLESSDILMKNATTDSGYLPMFPEISYYEWRMPETTFAVRTDILEAGGYTGAMSPETFDELHDMLVWFRDEADLPNALNISSFFAILDPWLLMGLGISGDYYMDDDGQVQYAPISDEYRTFLEYISDWYAEKLVDPDFYATTTNNPIDKLCITNTLGVSSMFSVFCADEFEFSMNPDLYLTAMKSPVVDKDNARYFPMYEEGDYSITLGRGTAVNAESDYVSEALRFLDFFYSDQGALMANYGIREADSADGDGTYYYDETGTPQSTDFIRGYAGYATVEFRIQYPLYFIQMYELDAYTDKLMSAVQPVIDQQNSETCYERRLPDNYSMTSDEGYTLTGIMNDVSTYMEENVIKFIVGEKELNDATWDEYVQAVEQMNVAGAMDCIQAAVERYEDR